MSHTPGPWIWIHDTTTLVGVNNHVVLAIDLPEFIGDEDKALLAAAPDLLDSCKELRDALAGAMRVMVGHACAEGDALTEDFIAEMARLHIADGIGVRADTIIAKAEGAA
jgi:hypothetical protein